MGVPTVLADLGELRLILVDTLERMRVCNAWMRCEHPQGAGPLVGVLHLHSTRVLTTEGLPLGILRAHCSTPTPRANDDLCPALPDTRQVCMMDREADVFELFDEPRQSGRVEPWVRAQPDRATREELKLFELVRQSLVQSPLRITVPRQSARPGRANRRHATGLHHVTRTSTCATASAYTSEQTLHQNNVVLLLPVAGFGL